MPDAELLQLAANQSPPSAIEFGGQIIDQEDAMGTGQLEQHARLRESQRRRQQLDLTP
mgnify:CR=1 FL=1